MLPDLAFFAKGMSTAVGLLGIYLVMWQLFIVSVEDFRQNIFRLRRELYLFMLDGYIERSSPVYLALYRRLNGMLRFAEGIQFSRILFTRLFVKVPPDPLDTLIPQLGEPARTKVARIQTQSGVEIVKLLAKTSPIMWTALAVLAPVAILVALLKGMQRSFIHRTMRFLSERRTIKGAEVEAMVREEECEARAATA